MPLSGSVNLIYCMWKGYFLRYTESPELQDELRNRNINFHTDRIKTDLTTEHTLIVSGNQRKDISFDKHHSKCK